MTREEAIDILVGVIVANSDEEAEALDIAIEALQADKPMVIKCKPFFSEEDFKAFAEQVSEQNVILIPYEAEVVSTNTSTNTSTKSTNISTDTSADTVEVVRCKDCKWYESGGLPCPLDLCESLGDDGFCSCGERSEEWTKKN